MKKISYITLLSLALATACTNKETDLPQTIVIKNPAADSSPVTTATTNTISEQTKAAAKAKIENIRKKVVNKEMTIGEAAELYSDDPGSSKVGGRYMGIVPGQFVPEFEKVAFALKPGQISEVFETQYGFHFVQLIARRGNSIDVSHVLVIPK